jgi:hypothetical protein
MKNSLAQKVPVPKGSRIKTYYDSKKLIQNEAVVNFFPPNATRNVTRDNYINNPFPGEDKRRVVGLSFELIKQFIQDDDANGIDSEAIINAVKDAGVVLTADNDYKEFLRTTIDEHSNFSDTNFASVVASDYINSAVETAERKTAVMKGSGMYRLSDPFDVASNQTIDLRVEFADASSFPTEQQWIDSGQGQLWLRATLYVAEIEPKGK